MTAPQMMQRLKLCGAKTTKRMNNVMQIEYISFCYSRICSITSHCALPNKAETLLKQSF